MGAFQQLIGQLRFRREYHLVRDPGQLAVFPPAAHASGRYSARQSGRDPGLLRQLRMSHLDLESRLVMNATTAPHRQHRHKRVSLPSQSQDRELQLPYQYRLGGHSETLVVTWRGWNGTSRDFRRGPLNMMWRKCGRQRWACAQPGHRSHEPTV